MKSPFCALIAHLLVLTGCARHEGTRVISIPVGQTMAAINAEPTIDGFGSNMTTYHLLTQLTKPAFWSKLEPKRREKNLSAEDFSRTWRVERLSMWEEGRLKGVICRVSWKTDSAATAEAGLNVALETFAEFCEKYYGREYDPYVRQREMKTTQAVP